MRGFRPVVMLSLGEPAERVRGSLSRRCGLIYVRKYQPAMASIETSCWDPPNGIAQRVHHAHFPAPVYVIWLPMSIQAHV